MAERGGYTDLPGTYDGALDMIAQLLDEAKRAAALAAEKLRALNEAVAMIEAVRKATNSVEAPPQEPSAP